jgi:hypothetical protein
MQGNGCAHQSTRQYKTPAMRITYFNYYIYHLLMTIVTITCMYLVALLCGGGLGILSSDGGLCFIPFRWGEIFFL